MLTLTLKCVCVMIKQQQVERVIGPIGSCKQGERGEGGNGFNKRGRVIEGW